MTTMGGEQMKKIYVIHENSEWTIHLTKQLDQLGLPYEEWFLDEGMIDLSEEPPEGVFYSRMSASAHTRDHRYAPELTLAVHNWLEKHDRVVINGSRALLLEVSKVAQYMALNNAGIRTPKTIAAVGKQKIVQAAEQMNGQPFITKHNRAGKGLGVQLFHSVDALKEYLDGPTFEEPVDGITLIQQYIQAPEPYITRCEFVGGKFIYAVKVDTSEGFELCPADACSIEDLFCPVGDTGSTHTVETKQTTVAASVTKAQPKFQILDSIEAELIQKYESFIRQNDIYIAGIEFIRHVNGDIYTYDVNTNTNYNSEAEAIAGKFGMYEVAKYLGQQLEKL